MRNPIFAVTRCAILAIAVLSAFAGAQAQKYTFSTIYSFKNNGLDPAFPESYLTLDKTGNLYGTSSAGGSFGFGTVFKVSTKGAVSVLHSFAGQAAGDGAAPVANVAFDTAGNLDGTTTGGAGTFCTAGCGSIFSITPAGVESILWGNFNSIMGYAPSYLALDAKNNVWGFSSGPYAGDSGLIFETGPFTFENWYTFCGTPPCPNGEQVGGPFLIDTAGSMYGVTQLGGAFGYGTVFKFTHVNNVQSETVVHSFTSTDGSSPQGVIQDHVGNLYGVAAEGGANGWGTLFKVSKTGASASTLYNFCSLANCADGAQPTGRVQIDNSGNIYGVTIQANGNSGAGGVVWELTKAGKQIVLHTFGSNTTPGAGLTIDSAGNLWGVTFNGGTAHQGTVFKLTLAK